MKQTITLLLIFVVLNAAAQVQLNHAVISQITHLYNPAEAVDSVSLLHVNGRLQWVNISQQSPYMGSVYYRTRMKNGKLGFSTLFNQYRHGVYSQYALMCDGAYSLKTKSGFFQIGLRIGIEMSSNRLGEVNVVDGGDPFFQSGNSSQLMPNQGLGLKYVRNSWIVGASIPRLMQHQFSVSNQQVESTSKYDFPHAGLIAYSGYLLNKSNFDFKPLVGVIKSDFEPMQYWIDLSATYAKQVIAGIQVRPTTSYSIYLGYSYKEMLQLSCGFEVPLNAAISGYTGEIGLKWFITSSNKNVITHD